MPDLGEALLVRARNAIHAQLELPAEEECDHPALREPGATFVTLTSAGELRGCIGSLEAHRSLEHDVRANAIAAAFEDPRFLPMRNAEWPRVRVEVSLLSSAVEMSFAGEANAVAQLRPGVDGVILAWRGRRSTFLPQVWDTLSEPNAFLARLKQKAGLPADFWASDLTLHTYQVSKWKETQ